MANTDGSQLLGDNVQNVYEVNTPADAKRGLLWANDEIVKFIHATRAAPSEEGIDQEKLTILLANYARAGGQLLMTVWEEASRAAEARLKETIEENRREKERDEQRFAAAQEENRREKERDEQRFAAAQEENRREKERDEQRFAAAQKTRDDAAAERKALNERSQRHDTMMRRLTWAIVASTVAYTVAMIVGLVHTWSTAAPIINVQPAQVTVQAPAPLVIPPAAVNVLLPEDSSRSHRRKQK